MCGAFWNRENQLSSDELKRIQFKLLQKQIRHIFRNSRFYQSKLKKANITPSDINSLQDLARIPLTSREELEQNFNELLAVPHSEIATIRMSSGTSGRPLRIAHTRRDIETIATASARRLEYNGVTNKDVVQITSAYGLWQGAWSMHWGAQKVGACIIPVGPADTERQILLIKQFGTTVLYAATNYHFRILEVAKALGEDMSKYNLKTVFCVAENPTDNQVELLKKGFGVKNVVSDYGATELPGFSANCVADRTVHHVWADYYIAEVVDPATHEPLAEGEKGELVLTSLQRQAFPLVRYLTRDITTLFGFEKCACGMSHPKISGDIDREDFMTKIRGVTVFPSQVEFLLNQFSELTGKCQIIVDKRTPKHEATLRAEVSDVFSMDTENALKEKIVTEMKTRIGVTFNEVVFITPAQLESKYKKVIVEA